MSNDAYACREHLFEQIKVVHGLSRGVPRNAWYIEPEGSNLHYVCEYRRGGQYSCGHPAKYYWRCDTGKLILNYSGESVATSNIYQIDENSPGFEEIKSWCDENNIISELKDGKLIFVYTEDNLEEVLSELNLVLEDGTLVEYYHELTIASSVVEDDVLEDHGLICETDYNIPNKIANWFAGKLPPGFKISWGKQPSSKRAKEGKYIYINAYQGSLINSLAANIEFTDLGKTFSIIGHTCQASTGLITLMDTKGNGIVDLLNEETPTNIWIPWKLSWYNKTHLEFLDIVLQRVSLYYNNKDEYDRIAEKEKEAIKVKQVEVLRTLATRNIENLKQAAKNNLDSLKKAVKENEDVYMHSLRQFDSAKISFMALEAFKVSEFDAGKEVDSLNKIKQIKSITIEDESLVITFKPIVCTAISRANRIEEKYSLGEIQLTIRTSESLGSNLNRIIQFENLTYPDEQYVGPHIQSPRARGGDDSEICLGTAQAPLLQLFSQFKFAAAVTYILSFLETANLDDAWGRHARDFPKILDN